MTCPGNDVNVGAGPMIVTCPGCGSKYRVRNEVVPQDGARMRCPRNSRAPIAIATGMTATIQPARAAVVQRIAAACINMCAARIAPSSTQRPRSTRSGSQRSPRARRSVNSSTVARPLRIHTRPSGVTASSAMRAATNDRPHTTIATVALA